MPANIAFRVDASSAIGTGHVQRCLTLARVLSERGAACVFLMDTRLPGHLEGVCAAAGFAVLPPEYSAIPKGCSWLIVDHYGLDKEWEMPARAYTERLFVIDDLANRAHAADMLLDQNLHPDAAARYAPYVSKDTTLLLSPHYALLRPEFAALRPAARVCNAVKRILVTFGGSDADNVTMLALKALAGLPQFSVDVVMGGSAAHLASIEAFACTQPSMTLHSNTPHMAALMGDADMAISAAGTTTWERCCLGLPSLVFAIADNQVELGQAAHDAGAHQYLGWFDETSVAALRQIIVDYAANAPLRKQHCETGMRLVDGYGAARVVAAMGF